MTRLQKQTLLVLTLIGLVYFVVLFFPNATGAEDEHMLGRLSGDESITYPYVVRILTPTDNLRSLPGRLILYSDYHYGYPFYFFSALVLLPLRLLYGEAFTANTQLNLLFLRQFISVLPILPAAAILVYLQTRFKSVLASAALFVFLLTLRGVFRNDLAWWHPDAGSILAITLTLFFLDRDRFRFGSNFYLAAIACGLATAIKLAGVWFFLTILVYLGVGLIWQRVQWKKVVLASLGFVALMGATVVLSNPFLFFRADRERMVEIQTFKTYELSHGYTHDDPAGYQKGPEFWEWTLRKWYAPVPLLGFLLVSLLAGCLWGPNRWLNLLILTWVVPYSIYLLYFVAPKPDHYWLPVMLPLFSCALNLFPIIRGWRIPNSLFRKAVIGAAVLVVAVMFIINLTDPFSGNIAVYTSILQQELVLR